MGKTKKGIPPMNELSITALFVCLDDFANLFEQWQRHHMMPSERKRFRQGKLSLDECMFVMASSIALPTATSSAVGNTASKATVAWNVEWTFAWLGRRRRLSKDCESTVASSLAWTQLAACRHLARRIARARVRPKENIVPA